MTRRFRILTFDGGGIRGVFSARLLERIVRQYPELLKSVDMIAGTSTGAIIALALAANLSPTEVRALYEGQSRAIFADSFFDDLRDLGNTIGAEYSETGLHKALNGVLKGWTLGDLKKLVLVPAFDLDGEIRGVRTWKPKLFHNMPGNGYDTLELAVEVAMRSAAAPTYFPSRSGFIDGGVFANDPAMCAVVQALSPDSVGLWREGGRTQLHELEVLSIGTGLTPQYVSGDRLDWGLAQWAPVLPSLLIEGAQGTVRYQCQALLGDRYHRLDTVLPKPVKLDDVKAVTALLALADQVELGPTVDWLRRHWSAPTINVDASTAAA